MPGAASRNCAILNSTPTRAAQLGIPLTDMAARRLGRANDISGGFVDVGRRQYTLRFSGRYDPEELSDFVSWTGATAGPIRLGRYSGPYGVKRRRPGTGQHTQNGNPAISIRDRQGK